MFLLEFIRRLSILTAFSLLVFLQCLNQASAKKVQFSVGFQSYQNVPVLTRPIEDSSAVADALMKIGFQSELGAVHDAERGEFFDRWNDFVESISPGDEVAVYLSGHGVEINGHGYILPTDIPFKNFRQRNRLTSHAISIAELIAQVSDKNPAISIFIIDACRNDPFIPIEYANAPTQTKSLMIGRGKGVSATTYNGHFTLYSARSGETSIERFKSGDRSSYSLFTRHLIPLITTTNINLTTMATKLVQNVGKAADLRGEKQTVSYMSGLDFRKQNYCLAGCTLPDNGISVDPDSVGNAPSPSSKPAKHLEGKNTDVQPDKIDSNYNIFDDKCTILAPGGVAVNVRDTPNGSKVGILAHQSQHAFSEFEKDKQGRSWGKLASSNGWIIKRYLDCRG